MVEVCIRNSHKTTRAGIQDLYLVVLIDRRPKIDLRPPNAWQAPVVGPPVHLDRYWVVWGQFLVKFK